MIPKSSLYRNNVVFLVGEVLVSVKDGFLELMVLVWLFSGQEEVVVIAERVTAVVDRKTRSLAFSALSHAKKESESA